MDDDANPRSLAFQLDRLREDLAALPRREEIDHQEDLLARAATRLLDRPRHGVELHPKAAADVRAFVIDVRGALLELNEAIVGTWFAHAYDPRRSGS